MSDDEEPAVKLAERIHPERTAFEPFWSEGEDGEPAVWCCRA